MAKKKPVHIIEPKKGELTEKGFTRLIQVAEGQTADSLIEYGFTNYNKPILYFARMVGTGISFNLSINKKDLSISNIDVLVEDFLQPYDYQSRILNESAVPQDKAVFRAVNKLLKQLQEDGIITGYTEGMYV